jgi:hypothetical protein
MIAKRLESPSQDVSEDALGPPSAMVRRDEAVEEAEGKARRKRRMLPTQRLRARRLRAKELNLGDVTAHVHSGSLGSITAIVEDFSLHGMALVIPSAAAKVVLAGDKLELVQVQIGNQVAYEGSVVVRRVSEAGEDLVLGVELHGTRSPNACTPSIATCCRMKFRAS